MSMSFSCPRFILDNWGARVLFAGQPDFRVVYMTTYNVNKICVRGVIDTTFHDSLSVNFGNKIIVLRGVKHS